MRTRTDERSTGAQQQGPPAAHPDPPPLANNHQGISRVLDQPSPPAPKAPPSQIRGKPGCILKHLRDLTHEGLTREGKSRDNSHSRSTVQAFLAHLCPVTTLQSQSTAAVTEQATDPGWRAETEPVSSTELQGGVAGADRPGQDHTTRKQQSSSYPASLQSSCAFNSSSSS